MSVDKLISSDSHIIEPPDLWASRMEAKFGDRAFIGVEALMWGSDYPHTEATFPRSCQILERILEGVTDEERRKITCANAAQLYQFDLN
jgi:predicted TIM-barrel fold metal-dependent hydrolase